MQEIHTLEKDASKSRHFQRVMASKISWSKTCRVLDKRQKKKQALASGEPQGKAYVNPTSRYFSPEQEPDLDCEDDLKDDDFDEEEEENLLSNLPTEEDCDLTSETIFKVLMWQKTTDLSPEYIRQLYEQRSIMRAEEHAFIKDCWDVIFQSCQ
jgi:hypothetical protein